MGRRVGMGRSTLHCPLHSREYGDRWHQAGIFERRQNAYDDFQAAAEYLIKNHYTSPRK